MELTNEKKQRAAMACRAAAYRASEDAKAQSNPSVRRNFEADAKAYEDLAEEFEAARTDVARR